MARVFCVANQKGGVGKTTTTLNLAAGLAHSGAHTLVVDLDPQCNATTGLGHQPTGSHPLVTATPIRQGVVATAVAGLELLSGSRSFRDVELLTRDDSRQSARIREQLLTGFAGYDFVLIDCPPSLGPLTRTALSSSTEVFMPIQCEYFAMEGLAQMIEVIRDVMQAPAGQVVNLPAPDQIIDRLASPSAARQPNNLPHAADTLPHVSPRPSLQFGGIVLTMYDHSLELTHEVDEEVRDFFGEIVFRTVIPRDVAVSEAPSHGKSVMDYAPRSRGARAYIELCMEVLDRE
ncbi:MAG: ParA family protein [Planctomycetaceae bacterium]|nr:ParA family protein [Planctomycetaceae bacterium]